MYSCGVNNYSIKWSFKDTAVKITSPSNSITIELDELYAMVIALNFCLSFVNSLIICNLIFLKDKYKVSVNLTDRYY